MKMNTNKEFNWTVDYQKGEDMLLASEHFGAKSFGNTVFVLQAINTDNLKHWFTVHFLKFRLSSKMDCEALI